jgi:hypothetical protein
MGKKPNSKRTREARVGHTYYVGTKQRFRKSKEVFLLDLHCFYSVSSFLISFLHLLFCCFSTLFLHQLLFSGVSLFLARGCPVALAELQNRNIKHQYNFDDYLHMWVYVVVIRQICLNHERHSVHPNADTVQLSSSGFVVFRVSTNKTSGARLSIISSQRVERQYQVFM